MMNISGREQYIDSLKTMWHTTVCPTYIDFIWWTLLHK